MNEPKVKKPIYKKWWFWVIAIFFGISYLGSKLPPTQKSEDIPVQDVVKNTSTPELKINYTYDVPSLLDKNSDQIKTELKPYLNKSVEPTQEQINLGVKDWDLSFTKDNKDLLISYNITTKKVNDFFISTDDKSGKTKDTKHLLELGNVKENDSRYKVEFVKTFVDPSTFTGIKIIPQ